MTDKEAAHLLSNHRLQALLSEMKEISRTDMALYQENGKLSAQTFQPAKELEASVAQFLASPAESQTVGQCHFFKIAVERQTEYVLLVRVAGEDSYVIGRLAASQIRNLEQAYQEQSDRNHFMQNVLLGNMTAPDIYNRAKRLHIQQAERVVFVIEVEAQADDIVMETVKNLFVDGGKDFITKVDGQNIILVKDAREYADEDSLFALAEMMVDNLHTEAMVPVRVGFGNRTSSLEDLARSYHEARVALDVGHVFYAEKKCVAYARLGIGRLIYQLPIDLCEEFLREVFKGRTLDIFNEETNLTIQKFFENNLNVSETARQLPVHRNTLMYRLERIEKAIGLDLRKFEDAMLFKIAMMVMARVEAIRGSSS